jgi:hypothetical protein
MLSPQNLELMKEFESKVLELPLYKTSCQIAGKKMMKNVGGTNINSYEYVQGDAAPCGATQSLVNDAYLDATVHETLMTQQCLTMSLVCKAGGAFCTENISSSTTVPCIACGAGGTPFGTPPCRASTQTPWGTTNLGVEALCKGLALPNVGLDKKTRAYYEEQETKLLPKKFACNGQVPGQAQYARSYIAFGAPLKGHTTFTGDGKEDQEDDYTSWFVKDLWPDIVQARKDVEKKK